MFRTGLKRTKEISSSVSLYVPRGRWSGFGTREAKPDDNKAPKVGLEAFSTRIYVAKMTKTGQK